MGNEGKGRGMEVCDSPPKYVMEVKNDLYRVVVASHSIVNLTNDLLRQENAKE